MLIIPAVNEVDFEKVKSRLLQALALLKNTPENNRWVHLDVSDGEFTPNRLWNNPAEAVALSALAKKSGVKLEVHLMIREPERHLGDWLRSGVNRVIIHHEAMELKDNTMLFGDAVVVGAGPETAAADYLECIRFAPRVLLLAVPPGRAGQRFDERTVEKIDFLKKALPNVIIEVDGGVNLETARALKKAGADVLVSASYLWNAPDPAAAYQALSDI